MKICISLTSQSHKSVSTSAGAREVWRLDVSGIRGDQCILRWVQHVTK